MRLTSRHSLIVASVLLASSIIGGCSGGGSPTTPVTTGSNAQSMSAHRVNAPFKYGTHPHLRLISSLLLHSNCTDTFGQCLAPTNVKGGYNFPSGNAGQGQTIVIVDAFGSPTIASDLTTFDSTYGLSNPPNFQILYPGGKPSKFDSGNTNVINWAIETSLDVEWAHVAAPGANIVLVVAANDQGQSIQSAQEYVVTNHLGNVMSLSFGVQEASINGGANNTQLVQARSIYQQAKSAKITVVAAAGDCGAIGTTGASGVCPSGVFAANNPEYPASDPAVLSVGGTNLNIKHNNSYVNETVWNDANDCVSPCLLGPDGATGGAPSMFFTDKYQSATVCATTVPGNPFVRCVADVAYNASPNTGVVVCVSFASQAGLGPNGCNYAVGGTSQGPPQWSGIIAAANASRAQPLGCINDELSGIATSTALTRTPALHNVTVGNNTFPTGAPVAGYSAGSGYNLPTGWGSPDVSNLLTSLAALPDRDPSIACL